jgi:hypothetical protein
VLKPHVMQGFTFKGFKAPGAPSALEVDEKQHIQISDEEYSDEEYEEIQDEELDQVIAKGGLPKPQRQGSSSVDQKNGRYEEAGREPLAHH